MFREATEDHRRKVKEELYRAFVCDPAEPRKAQEADIEREAPRSATDRLDHLHKQLVALEIGATQTRAVLREWMGAAPFDDRQDRQAPNGLFAQLETTVNDLRTILEDIQVLVGGE